MINVSANCLFHYTKKFKNLKSILREQAFIYNMVPEYQSFNMPSSISEDTFRHEVPMVCFCDLPLTQTNRHIKKFGAYALGLSKSWAKSKNISPVIYTHKNSPIMDKQMIISATLSKRSIGEKIDYYKKHLLQSGIAENNKQLDEIEKKMPEKAKIIIEILNNSINNDYEYLTKKIAPFIKMIEDEKYKDYYDEREWRAIKWPSRAGERNKLTFSFDDLEWIIVKNDAEAEAIAKILLPKQTGGSLHIIHKKIITKDRLKKII